MTAPTKMTVRLQQCLPTAATAKGTAHAQQLQLGSCWCFLPSPHVPELQGDAAVDKADPHALCAPAAGVWKAAAALLGDLASSVSGVGVLFQQKPFVLSFIQRCGQDPSLADTARWAGQMISKAMQG